VSGLGIRQHREPERVAAARHDNVTPVEVEPEIGVGGEDPGLRIELRPVRAQHVGLQAPRLELANHRAWHLLAQVPPFHYECDLRCHDLFSLISRPEGTAGRQVLYLPRAFRAQRRDRVSAVTRRVTQSLSCCVLSASPRSTSAGTPRPVGARPRRDRSTLRRGGTPARRARAGRPRSAHCAGWRGSSSPPHTMPRARTAPGSRDTQARGTPAPPPPPPPAPPPPPPPKRKNPPPGGPKKTKPPHPPKPPTQATPPQRPEKNTPKHQPSGP